MKKIIAVFLFFLFCSSAQAATYYMATTGSNSNDGSEGSPWLTLQYSTSQMSGGDTLIIEDGTYTGPSNGLTTATFPPAGSAGSYTIIKARNDGGVLFDGQGTNNMFYYWTLNNTTSPRYCQFEGIVWGNTADSNIGLYYASYVKFLRCGAYESDPGAYNFDIGRNNDYILVEQCYAWGSGRYKFSSYLSDHVVFRTCVGRMDWADTTGPIGIFSIYNTDYAQVQNCIAIDSDQDSTWLNYELRHGSFFVPSTGGTASNIAFSNCVALNNELGGFFVTENASSISYDNCVFWNCNCGTNANYYNWLRGSTTTINHITLGINDLNNGYYYHIYADGTGESIKNSIFYSLVDGYVMRYVDSESYNSFYGNTENIYNGSPAASDITNINPLTNSLLYITRIEDGSDLDGAGESGSDIGANIKTLIGTSGTLYGETGYNTDTGVSMWPFPNETLIRTKMKAYSGGGVSGDRGFCADGETLTHYIMNYLGNGNPYATGSGVHTPLSGRVSITGRQSVN